MSAVRNKVPKKNKTSKNKKHSGSGAFDSASQHRKGSVAILSNPNPGALPIKRKKNTSKGPETRDDPLKGVLKTSSSIPSGTTTPDKPSGPVLVRSKSGRGIGTAKERRDIATSSSKPKIQFSVTRISPIERSGFFHKNDIILKTEPALEAARALDLQQWHLQRLRRAFNHIDVDRSGTIDREEFLRSVGEQRSPFTDRLFDLIDLDGSGTIDFEEYVRVMATYCMYSKDEIMRFCFDCFDIDGSNTIDENEFVQLCKIINNAAPAFPNNFKNALQSFDVNSDGLIDYPEFLEIERRFPIMLFPAFRLQDAMQRNSLGEQTWLRINENHTRNNRVEEYKRIHNGRLPPDPLYVTILKTVAPCFFSPRSQGVKYAVGTAMESGIIDTDKK